MSALRIRMLEDRHLRNSAKALVEADIAHIKSDPVSYTHLTLPTKA